MNTSIDYIQVLILTEFCVNSERVITRHKTAFLNPGVSKELRTVPGLQRKTALGGDRIYMLQSEMSSVSSSHTPTGGKARETSEFPAATTYLAKVCDITGRHYNARNSDVSLALPPIWGWCEETVDISDYPLRAAKAVGQFEIVQIDIWLRG